MILGLTPQEQKIVEQILSEYPDYDFFYYGSRVKGNFWKGSDLDILIHGKSEMPYLLLDELKDRFDNSSLSFVVNFCDFHNIDQLFYKNIQQDLVPCIESK